ncbi:MAG: phosphoribosylanthranilate isomerase [Desulfomonilaceae bacterium]|nr:phosphoribosylanthranilate isomerase [Desulfomonilaceae bacterium]
MDSSACPIRIKICGITRKQDARAAVKAGAHALGFVFYPSSPRYIHPADAAEIIAGLPPFVSAVGVFVNRDRSGVHKDALQSGIHVIQLHGDETAEESMGYGRPVIKAFRFSPVGPLPDLLSFPSAGCLLDTGMPGRWGGTGVPSDWHRLRDLLDAGPDSVRSRLILAGGLRSDNVGRAIGLVRPYAVDVSSGVETAPGEKSEEMIKEFIHAVHNAGRAE